MIYRLHLENKEHMRNQMHYFCTLCKISFWWFL